MGCCPKGPPAVPMFPLTMDIYWNTFGLLPPVGPPNVAAVPCQHVVGELMSWQNPAAANYNLSYVKCPKATDIHFLRGPMGPDYIELPVGSGLWYQVTYVINMSRGFTNEHRCVMVFPVPGPGFPIPIP